jgi:hypothetical protein
MNKKLFFVCLIILALLVGLSLNSALAKKAGDSEQILPEKDGVYDVPGRPNLKVRVFVHQPKAKPVKPTPSPTPAPELVCTLEDNSATDLVDRAGWKLPEAVNYWLNYASAPASLGGAENLEKIVDNSFSAWAERAGVSVQKSGDTFITRAAQDGKWLVIWGRTSPSALGVTYIWYIPSNGTVVEIDTIMNQKYFWRWSDPSSWLPADESCAYPDAYDAQNILTHEIGHWFGLGDHYTDNYEDHTMYGYGSKGETKKDTLTNGDILGLEAIY